MQIGRSQLVTLFLSCVLCISFAVSANCQQPSKGKPNEPDEKQLLRELLSEVRQMRSLLQRANLTIYRAQILMERIRAQQTRVDRLMRQLEDARNELAGIKLSQIQLNGQIKDLEDQIKIETNTEARDKEEAEYKELKRALEQQQQREGQLSEQRDYLSGELQVAQVKLDSLNTDLADIEKTLQQQSLKVNNEN